MLSRLHDIFIGPPLPTNQSADQKLNKLRALAAFSPDALSSIAYANQEIYLGLVVAGAAGLQLAMPIGLVIIGLLLVVSLSYFQTIHGYPGGGGSYVVARSNLGSMPGLVTAAALLVDYVLNVAVSVTAGVAAIASAFPALWPHRVALALVLLLIITLANLRGMRETGTLMSIPVYLFLGTYLAMIVYGLIRLAVEGPTIPVLSSPAAIQPLTLILILHAFSTGCTALTGIESISDNVPAFRPSEPRNAGRTLIAMAVLMGVLFLGSLSLTQFMGVVAGPQETILSALAHRLLGGGVAYYIIQASTLLILAVAANTSFAGFPRVAAIVAKDGFLPRQMTNLGDRLVYSNGIMALSVVSGLLVVLFKGDSHLLIPLFAIGAFLAFTLSQAGMVVHWWHEHGPGWGLKSVINGVGALTTCVTLLVVGVSKFLQGAWLTVLIIPLIVFIFLKVRSHYQKVADELTMHGLPPSLRPAPPPRVVIPVSGVHRAMVDAVNFARSISNEVTAVYVELEPGAGENMRAHWNEWWPDVPMVVVASPYRSIVGPLVTYLDTTDEKINDGRLATIILPEFIPSHWWQNLLHNQTAWVLKATLLYHRRRGGNQRVIIDVPYRLKSN
jgi:amino acid transporter